jgi:hypothetical protein
MIVIIEGPDRVGKDSLLSQGVFTEYEHIHCGSPKLKTKDYYYGYYTGLYQSLNQLNNRVALNRSSIGEYVYGPLYRNNEYELLDIVDPHQIITNHEVRIITLIDSVETLLSREDGESFGKTLQAKKDEIYRFIKVTEFFNGAVVNCAGKTSNEVYEEVVGVMYG